MFAEATIRTDAGTWLMLRAALIPTRSVIHVNQPVTKFSLKYDC